MLLQAKSKCIHYKTTTARVFPLDGWESDEDDDDDGEWVDIYHSSDDEEEVQFVYFRFVGLNVCF